MDFHDPVAAGLHLGFAVWCLFAGAILFRLTRRHPPGHRLAVAVYAASAVALYTASGLFHSLRYDPADPAYEEFFRRLDLSAVFGLIAGSCVPIFVYLLPAVWKRVGLLMELGGAAAGIGLVWAMRDVVTDTLIYVFVGMGFAATIPMRHLHRRIRAPGVALIAAFTGFYLLGAVAQAVKWPGYYHVVLHLADMIATLLHLILLVKYVLPHGAPPAVAPGAVGVA